MPGSTGPHLPVHTYIRGGLNERSLRPPRIYVNRLSYVWHVPPLSVAVLSPHFQAGCATSERQLHSFFSIAAGGEDSQELAFTIRDADLAERQSPMVDDFLRFGRDDGAQARAMDESDIGRRSDRERAMTVGSSGEGQVGQREQHTALYAATCIQMAGFNRHLRTGIAFARFEDGDAVQQCKLVVDEELFQLLLVHRLTS